MKTATCLVCGFEGEFTAGDKGFASDFKAQLQKCAVFKEQGAEPKTQCPHFLEAIHQTA